MAKRYIKEKGSDEVEELCAKADTLVVSTICMPEIVSALCRLKRQELITKAEYKKAKHAFMKDLEDMSVCELVPQVIAGSVGILEEHALRAMDALHLASAVETEPEMFVSGDTRQVAAAEKLGMKVIKV